MVKYIDIPSVMQVIGGVYLDNSLLDNDKYSFLEDDFTEEFHKILFGSIYNIHLLGAETITAEAIEHYLEQRPKAYGVYQSNKGREYLQRLAEITQLSTFDYYYQRVKKMTLLRQYQKAGIDVTWLYNPEDVLNIKKKQAQEDWFDRVTLEEIADLIDDKIELIKLKYAEGANEEVQQAGDGIFEFIEDLKQNPEYGYPLYGPLINSITRGARPKKLYLRSAATGIGKALTNDTILPTPDGFRKVRDIQEGDYLFGSDGKPTKVLKRYPQPEAKNIYEVELIDGRVIQCCKDHLWRVKDNKNKRYETISANEMMQRKNRLRIMTGSHYRWTIDLPQPIQYKPQKHLVEPFDMGQRLAFIEEDMSIPQEYLIDSPENKIALLRGLFPKWDSKKTIEFTTTFPIFARDIVSLVRSLGIYTSIEEKWRTEGQCTIYIKKNIYCVSVVDIRRRDEKAEMTCFTVDAKDHLFLCGDYVITHNTRTMIADACTFACKEIFNRDTGEWETKDYCVPSLFIATEQDMGEIQSMLLAFVADVDEEHILTGKYDDKNGEWERVKYAAKIIQESPLYIDQLPEFSMEDVVKVIKRAVHDHGIKGVFFDYLHSTTKILSEISSKSGVKGLREDNILFMISVKLKEIANEYGIFVMSSTQLSGDFSSSRVLDQSFLRGAKSIADSIDVGMIMVKATPEDYEYLTTIMDMGYDKPDVKLAIYKNRRGRYKDILLWCKSRRDSCRIIPMFATDYDYELITIPDIDIKIKGA